MNHSKLDVIEFAQYARSKDGDIEDLYADFFSQICDDFTNVVDQVAQICAVTVSEIQQGKKYGNLRMARQLISYALSLNGYSFVAISRRLPFLGKPGAVSSQAKLCAHNLWRKEYDAALNQIQL